MNPYPTDDEDLLAELYELDCARYDKRKEKEEEAPFNGRYDAGLIHQTAYSGPDSMMMAYLNEHPKPQETPVPKLTAETTEALEELWNEMHPARPTPKPIIVPTPEVTQMSADRVMRALAQDPTLLFDVACRMGATRLAILGPWSEQEEKERDPQGRITRINWVRRFDAVGSAKSYICINYRMDDHGREVLDKIEWQVYIKQTDPNSPHIISHHAKGETYSVMEAQRAADEAAVERGWMLVD